MTAKRRPKGSRSVGARRRSRRGRLLVPVVFLITILLAVLWALELDDSPSPETPPAVDEVEHLTVEVLHARPHDPAAFTQGLLWHEGKLYESTGLYGLSTLRRVDAATGTVEERVDLSPHFFGEGLAGLGDRLVQLTWREGVALVWDRESLRELERFAYEGEGWGLCHDGRRLVMSDGSSWLTLRDPENFQVLRRLEVRLRGQPVGQLNELECVEGWIYANVYAADWILRIDPESGRVTALVQASGLLTAEEAAAADMLNGIAYDAARQVFFLTGKRWPKLFEVRFVVAAPG